MHPLQLFQFWLFSKEKSLDKMENFNHCIHYLHQDSPLVNPIGERKGVSLQENTSEKEELTGAQPC